MSAIYAFDAYGTLLNVHAAVARHASAVGADAGRLSDLWRAKQLEYSWVLSLMQRYEPFWNLTERALDHALARVPSVPTSVRGDLLDAYRRLSAYAEAPSVLKTLRARGCKTAVLSNGSPEMLHTAFDASGLLPLLDRMISADEVRVFKTSPRVYALVTSAFGVNPADVTLVSSNRWDVAGAIAFGMRAIWVNRFDSPMEYDELPPTAVCNDLHGVLQLQ